MSSSSSAPRTVAARLVLALLGLAVAVFFGVIGVLILRAPIDGNPAWVGWLLRGFVLFIFGGIAAGGLVASWLVIRGEGSPAVPEAVRARCPACGEPWADGDACRYCGEARAGVVEAWRDLEREGAGAALFGGAMGAGMVCLGLFVGGYALFGDEARTLLAIAYVGLALLLVCVGGALVWGSAIAARDAVRALGVRELQLQLAPSARSIAADARVERGTVRLRGASARFVAVDETPAPAPGPGPLPAATRALIRVVAVLHARGEASLTFADKLVWSHEPGRRPAELVREISTDVLIDTAPPRVVGLHGDDGALEVPPPAKPVDARDIVLMAIAADPSARALAAAVAASPELANAFETFAKRLAASEADEHVQAVLAGVLCTVAPPPSAPYREAA